MRIWISGCGGMMGSHLCGALAVAGHEVLASYYKPTVDPADLADLPLEEVDIRDWCSVYDSLTRFRPDAVFHLAAQSYPTVSWQRPVHALWATRWCRGGVRSRRWRPMLSAPPMSWRRYGVSARMFMSWLPDRRRNMGRV